MFNSQGDDFESKVKLNHCKTDPQRVLDCEVGCDDGSSSLLQSLIDVAGTCGVESINLEHMWGKLDKEAYLRHAAVDRVIGHWDGFCGSNYNNYRVHYGDSKFQIIPWSTDMTFNEGTPVGKDSYKCLQMKACLQNRACEAEYDRVYKAVIQTFRSAKKELVAFVELASAQAAQTQNIGKKYKCPDVRCTPMNLITGL